MTATITQVITSLPAAPDPATDTPANFSIKAAASVLAQNGLPTELNAFGTQANALAVDVNLKATTAASSALDSSNSAASASSSAATALSMANAAAYSDTSTTSLAIATGSKVFTVTAGKSWGPGMNLVAQATAGNNMTGTVVSYSGTTLTINVLNVRGSGTFASWAISMAPPNLGLVLLATLTPTASAAVNALTVFNSTYDSYLILGEGIVPSGNDVIYLRFANAGTLDGANNYSRAANFSTLAVAGYGSSYADVSSGTIGTSGRGINFSIQVDNVNDATGIKTSSVRAGYENATADNYQQTVISTGYKGGVITGVGFLWNGASNFKAQGSIRIYGIQKA
jgi:hypothetical protein